MCLNQYLEETWTTTLIKYKVHKLKDVERIEILCPATKRICILLLYYQQEQPLLCCKEWERNKEDELLWPVKRICIVLLCTFFTSTATTIHDKITKVVHGEVLRRANDVDTYLAPLLVNELNEGIKCVETSNKLSVTSKDIIRTAPSTSTITTNSPTFTKVSK